MPYTYNEIGTLLFTVDFSKSGSEVLRYELTMKYRIEPATDKKELPVTIVWECAFFDTLDNSLGIYASIQVFTFRHSSKENDFKDIKSAVKDSMEKSFKHFKTLTPSSITDWEEYLLPSADLIELQNHVQLAGF